MLIVPHIALYVDRFLLENVDHPYSFCLESSDERAEISSRRYAKSLRVVQLVMAGSFFLTQQQNNAEHAY